MFPARGSSLIKPESPRSRHKKKPRPKLGSLITLTGRRAYLARDYSLTTSAPDNFTLRSLTAAKRLTPWDENRCFLLDPRAQDTKKDPNRSWGPLIVLTGRRAYLARDYSLTTSAAEKLNCCQKSAHVGWEQVFPSRSEGPRHKKRPQPKLGPFNNLTGRRAYLARDYSLTTSAAEKLNCCVRDGNRCFLLAMITRKPSSAKSA